MKFESYDAYVQHVADCLSKEKLATQPAQFTTPTSRTLEVLWYSMETAKPPIDLTEQGFFWKTRIRVAGAAYPIRRKLAKLLKAGAKIRKIIYYDPQLATTCRIAGVVIQIPETFFAD